MRRLAACLMIAACGPAPRAAVAVPPRVPRTAAPPPQTIRVDAERITLDGAPVADARALEARGRAARLPELNAGLTAAREAWKRTHPTATLPDEQWLDVAPGAGSASALSALLTAAFAGYRHVHLRVGDGWTDGLYDLPVGPDAVVHTRLELRLDGGGADAVWQSDKDCAAVPASAHVATSELPAYLARACGAERPCVSMARIVFDYGVAFADVGRALAEVRLRADESFVFALQRTDPGSASGNPERSCGAPLRLGRRKGQLPAEAIQSVVRAEQKRMRTCYEQGLKRDPGLSGRVTVRIVINADGRVQEATSVDHPTDFATTGPSDEGESRVTAMPDRAVATCIVNVYRTLLFPKPEGPVTVVYPLEFGHGSAAPSE